MNAEEFEEWLSEHYYPCEGVSETSVRALYERLTEWTPVEEKQPEKHGIYLVTLRTLYDDEEDNGRPGDCEISIARFDGHGWYVPFASFCNVVAWRPLPEPWKGTNER